MNSITNRQTKRLSLAGLLVIILTACTKTPQFDQVYKVTSPASLQAGQAIPAPKDPVILTVTGKIGTKNAGDQIVMDLPTIESVGVVEYTVDDPFDNKKIVYTGVLMRDLLNLWQVNKSATQLHFVALNDYSIDIPIAEFREYPILFGLQADGKYMQPDYHGPAMIIYPLNDYKFDSVAILQKLIWQIKSIDIQ